MVSGFESSVFHSGIVKGLYIAAVYPSQMVVETGKANVVGRSTSFACMAVPLTEGREGTLGRHAHVSLPE